jgi:hypothetical protein
MFLSGIDPGDGVHELDFRFELFPEEDRFLFAHHGAKLSELIEVQGLRTLGSTFYMVEMGYPFSFSEVIGNTGLLRDRYGIEPLLVDGGYLQFDSQSLTTFFENTRKDFELDCTILGTDEPRLTEQAVTRFLECLKNGPNQMPGDSIRSWLHIHDNHFLWLGAKPTGLLRRLIAASLVGFFNHVHRHNYTPLPDNLIDLILAKYHTAPLVCHATAWDQSVADEVPSGVQIESDTIRALVETKGTSWIAYQLNPPKELVGRALLISYQFQGESWSFEEWQ